MANVFLSLGSNLGSSYHIFEQAVESIKEIQGTSVFCSSSVYETEPWGNSGQADFLNIVLQIETVLSPLALLDALQEVENRYGRQRIQKWAERTLDIDILLYDDLIIKYPRLIIPHLAMQLRNFVLIPLMEIAPTLQYPQTNETIRELVEKSPDQCYVFKIMEPIIDEQIISYSD